MSSGQKKGIVISALSFLLAYVLGVMFFHLTQVLDVLIPGVFIVATSQVTILPLVIVFNVIAAIVAFGKKE